MNIVRFRYFIEVAKAGGITAAASKCFISQTAVSQQMDALERDLGVQLLIRNRTGTRLTAAGQAILPKAQELMQCYQEIVEEAERQAGMPAEIVIAYTGPVEQRLLQTAVPQFRSLFPNIAVSLRQFAMPEIAESLECGLCDIALTLSGEIVLSGCQRCIVLETPMYVALSPRSHLANRPVLTFDEMHEKRLILLQSNATSHANSTIEQWLNSIHWPRENILYADTIDTQLLMVSLNQGFSLFPRAACPSGICLVPLAEHSAFNQQIEAVIQRSTPAINTMLELLRKAGSSLEQPRTAPCALTEEGTLTSSP